MLRSKPIKRNGGRELGVKLSLGIAEKKFRDVILPQLGLEDTQKSARMNSGFAVALCAEMKMCGIVCEGESRGR